MGKLDYVREWINATRKSQKTTDRTRQFCVDVEQALIELRETTLDIAAKIAEQAQLEHLQNRDDLDVLGEIEKASTQARCAETAESISWRIKKSPRVRI